MVTTLHTPLNLQEFEFNETFPKELSLDDMMQITLAVLTAREAGGQQPLSSEDNGKLQVMVYGKDTFFDVNQLALPITEFNGYPSVTVSDIDAQSTLDNINNSLNDIELVIEDVWDDANNALRVDQIA